MRLQMKAAIVAVIAAVAVILTSEPAYAVYLPCDCRDWWCVIFPIC